ncbi:MAG: hypothetical protein PHY34_02595 [Patescibacteria group bacterium]|nr:hypothetical protein [Patescibacteria group bacterium]MDD5715467.1 hypothetical protein [Patescibacteria group bacterium]
MAEKKQQDKIRKPLHRPSTQQYLPILEIRDDTVILKDGTLRGIILVSSINFALKSEDEQNAVIQGYIQFLNTLDFPLQIVIQSRKLNIDDYLDRLKAIEKEQTNELLKVQTREYRQYVAELVSLADIMSKRFYIIVPYTGGSIRSKGFLARLKEAASPTTVISIKQKKFEKNRIELAKRLEYIIDGLSSIGLKAAVLDTQGLIELYYNTYNPDTYDQQRLDDINKLNLE